MVTKIETEYDMIKLLREIKIMRALNDLSNKVIEQNVSPLLLDIISSGPTKFD
jgi:hypothetical protein